VTTQKLPPPHLRRKPEAAKRYPDAALKVFRPAVGMQLNLGGQVWKITEVKSRGRWKAAFKGERPRFRPETGVGLNFNEPGTIQEIYRAKKRSFWAKPLRVKGAGGNN